MKTKKILIIVCIFVLIYFVGGIVYSFTRKEFNAIEKEEATIKGYNYIMLTKDLSIFKDEYKILKKNLENENIDYLEYAKSISKLFIIDLFSLDNKKNMYDIGGTEFVFPSILDNFKLNAENTLYKYIEDNSNGDRKQELPLVNNVIINNIEESNYKIGEIEYSGYKVSLNIEYKKDLGYSNKAELIIIKEDNFLYIVEMN